MIFTKKKTEKKENNATAKRHMTFGRNRVFAIILWSIFILAFIWSVYKNFTAINVHTIEKTKVVEKELFDTSSIESFLSEFIDVYYTYDSNDSDSLSERLEELSRFVSDDVLQLNSNLITGDSKVSSSVLTSYIWSVEEKKENYFSVSYSVSQGIKRTSIENTTETVTEKVAGKEVTKKIDKPVAKENYSVTNNSYSVTVFVDEVNNLIITQNPTITSVPVKSDLYSPKVISSDNSVSIEDKEEITEFLNTFFAQYPKSDKVTLSYYVENNALPVITADYKFVALKNLVFKTVDDQIKAYLIVDYIDQQTNLHTYSQYCLGLEKKEQWVIVSSDLYV